MDTVRVAVVAALMFVALPRVLVPGMGRPGSPRALEDAARMVALTAVVTIGLAVAGLLDPVALMLALLGAGAALRLLPGWLRGRRDGARAAVARWLYDLLERRRRRRLGGSAGASAALALVGVALVSVELRGASAAGEGHRDALALVGAGQLPAGDDPSEAAVALLAAVLRLLDISAGALLEAAPSVAVVATTAAAVGATRRVAGGWRPALLAGGLNLAMVHGAGLAPTSAPAELDVISLDLAAALALVAAVLVAGGHEGGGAPLPTAAAAAAAAALNPVTAALAWVAGALGVAWSARSLRIPVPALTRAAAGAIGTATGVGAVGVDGAIPDGAFVSGRVPPPILLELPVAVAAALAAAGALTAVALRRSAPSAPGAVAVGLLALGLLAVAAAPGDAGGLGDAAAARLAAPAIASAYALAVWLAVRSARYQMVGQSAPSSPCLSEK